MKKINIAEAEGAAAELVKVKQLTIEEYEELIAKAAELDRLRARRSEGGRKAAANLTPEERRSRATKASHARRVMNKK